MLALLCHPSLQDVADLDDCNYGEGLFSCCAIDSLKRMIGKDVRMIGKNMGVIAKDMRMITKDMGTIAKDVERSNRIVLPF